VSYATLSCVRSSLWSSLGDILFRVSGGLSQRLPPLDDEEDSAVSYRNRAVARSLPDFPRSHQPPSDNKQVSGRMESLSRRLWRGSD
jgi:hypothetical protein